MFPVLDRMRIRLTILSTCMALCGSGVLTPTEADAGYLFASEASGALIERSTAIPHSLASAENEQKRQQAENLQRLMRLLFRQGLQEVPAGEQDGVPSSSSTSSGGAGVYAVLAPPHTAPLPLVERLRPGQHCWTPPPFLSGVFRPPRLSA